MSCELFGYIDTDRFTVVEINWVTFQYTNYEFFYVVYRIYFHIGGFKTVFNLFSKKFLSLYYCISILMGFNEDTFGYV